MRIRVLAMLCLGAACAGTPVRTRPELPDLELRMVAVEGVGLEILPAWDGQAEVDVEIATVLMGSDVSHVSLTSDPEVPERRAIAVRLTERGALALAEVTRRRVGQRMAVIVDRRVVMTAVIRDPIEGGQMVITGEHMEDVYRRITRPTSQK